MNLVNEGSVKGNQYVGGIAGENQAGGVIENVNTSINLDVSGTGAKYFGGVTGTNSGTITNAHNTGDVLRVRGRIRRRHNRRKRERRRA